MYAYLITPMSRNAKTGPMPVTTSQSVSCPSACPLIQRGCYAKAGPLAAIWRALDRVKPGEKTAKAESGQTYKAHTSADLRRFIRSLGQGVLWRHNQAGDLPRVSGTQSIDADELLGIVDANKRAGARGFTYTHHDVVNNLHNRGMVAHANNSGFTINLSGNNLAHADVLASLSIGPVVAIVSVDQTENMISPAGRKVVMCPATQDRVKPVSCASCGLCAIANRSCIVAFPAHGASKRFVSENIAQ